MRICPICGRRYSDADTRCEVGDHGALISEYDARGSDWSPAPHAPAEAHTDPAYVSKTHEDRVRAARVYELPDASQKPDPRRVESTETRRLEVSPVSLGNMPRGAAKIYNDATGGASIHPNSYPSLDRGTEFPKPRHIVDAYPTPVLDEEATRPPIATRQPDAAYTGGARPYPRPFDWRKYALLPLILGAIAFGLVFFFMKSRSSDSNRSSIPASTPSSSLRPGQRAAGEGVPAPAASSSSSPSSPQNRSSAPAPEVASAPVTPRNARLSRPPTTAPSEKLLMESRPLTGSVAENAQKELSGLLRAWIDATNARDLNKQKVFYVPTLTTYYLKRHVPRASVLAEKPYVFGQADRVDIRASAPEIEFRHNSQMAVMRFRKNYVIEGRRVSRRGEVLQELQWVKTDNGWKIFSERDLRVLTLGVPS